MPELHDVVADARLDRHDAELGAAHGGVHGFAAGCLRSPPPHATTVALRMTIVLNRCIEPILWAASWRG
jgi:hypothetical protein